MDKLEFAIVGAGWRAETFLHIASCIPELRVVGVVSRRAERAAEVEAAWSIPTFGSIAELLDATQPAFVVPCVSADAMPATCLDLAKRKIPILAETPPAPSLDQLVELYRQLSDLGARIQVAEQFWAQPLHAARQAIINKGTIGKVDQVNLSVCHDYHAMSLIRRHLGVGFKNPTIRGHNLTTRVTEGPDRDGPPQSDRIVEAPVDLAVLNFGDRFAIYEFSPQQYRSWIRGQRVCIRGERGEIIDETVIYLTDSITPIRGDLIRHEAGVNGNHEGHHLKAIQFGDKWVYRNRFTPARLSDEEIAIASCLLDMRGFLANGDAVYSLEDACQDQYLALCCQKAIATGEAVETTSQIWARP